MPCTPRMADWNSFYTSPNKIYNVPCAMAVWLVNLTCEHMLQKGGLDYFDARASKRSQMFYDYIDNSDYYHTFVTDPKFRSRMNINFTISKDDDGVLVNKFIKEAEDLGWLDVRGHPMSTKRNYDTNCNSIRVTMYNPQRDDVLDTVLKFMD